MGNDIEINEVDIPPKSLLNGEIKSPVYMDALKFELPSEEIIEIDGVVRNFFNSQPLWLLSIMINIISKGKLKKSLVKNNFSEGSRVGHWKVTRSDNTEIVFGESLGFIEHRLSFCKVSNDKNEFMTMSSVKTHNGFGVFYFYFVKLVHMKLVKFAIKNMYEKKYKGAI
ncbi:MAG: DUF2867 domain-containing protein [Candidatus Thiodiazotropha sp. (ex Dulcina madagascariensis)]|nr:DUF2867 domain-containing protein [Candidatus Thiodiazotropha sp. (ex Dulcina madagascariensis)]